MTGVDRRSGDIAGDPLSKPLLLARIVCATLACIPLGLAALLPLFGWGWSAALADAAGTAMIFAILGIGNLAACIAISLLATRFTRSHVALAILSCVATAIANTPALLGFVLSVMLESNVAFVACLPFTMLGWAIAWPRRGAWTLHTAAEASAG